ncbi:iron-sulfur cluster assembly accessory protein [Marivirga sp. S37H4]|uniref:Iron-sulfur cluster assembly accessory protein n=1 Tax=Marivirga aurantiaca TaxID=2802615 RepID=A0A935C4U2_9BACT|nr:iron-sulfur cluster assembly accessory protein [Marivirga aurantiaca]MBK6263455.1 iron-sulfur cluster assembly accessory protein [Marivirga aurantiaca]
MIPVTITENAIKEIKNIMDNKSIPAEYGLRIGVRGGGGCSAAGMNYMLGFDKQKSTDKTFEIEGIPVYIEKSHVMYIIGMEIHFHDSNEARGFMFVNPETKEEKAVG